MNLEIKARKIIAKYLTPFVEFFYKVKIFGTNFKKPPIIILTPGKVASSSIYDTLKRKVKNPVYHIHLFTESLIMDSIKDNLNSGRQYAPLHLIISKILRKKMLNYDGEVFIITVIREPISRAISSFFQNLNYHENELNTKNFEINIFEAEKLLSSKLNHKICVHLENWFETEINKNFGIDVFEQKFDKKKYIISANNKNHLLLLKMEDIDEVFPTSIQEFLKLDEPIDLQKSNLSENKYYASTYNEIKNSIKIPKHTLEKIISSKYFQHFYSDKEKEIMRKWENFI